MFISNRMMFVSNNRKILNEFGRPHAQSQILVWENAFSPAALAYAKRLITDPAYRSAMIDLDNTQFVFVNDKKSSGFMAVSQDLYHQKKLPSLYNEHAPVSFAEIVPGNEAEKQILVSELIDRLTFPSGTSWEIGMYLLRIWTSTGDYEQHVHNFATLNLNVIGPRTLDKNGNMFSSNSVAMIPKKTLHSSPELPKGKLRLHFAAFRAL